MKPAELAEATDSKSGAQPGDGLDQFRQALNLNDFKKIDKDKSDSLTLDELSTAANDKSFSQEKIDAINGLADHLSNSPKLKMTFGDMEIPIKPIIAPWFKGARPGTGGGGGGSDKLDMGKDDPLADKAEKPKLTEEQLRERLGELATKVGKDFQQKSPGDSGRTFSRFLQNYSNIQGMWDVSKALPGDPMANMEAAMNSALSETGHSVKLHKPDEPGTPKHSWMKIVDGYMTIDPPSDPKSKNAMVGSGIIGLRGN